MDSEDLQKELRASLILSRLPDCGPARYWLLRKVFGTCHAALQAPLKRLGELLPADALEELRAYQQNTSSHPLVLQAERDLDWSHENGLSLLTPDCPDYPELLKTIHNAPPLLYVQGSVANLALPQMAIVGSRHPSPSGRTNAYEFARQLCRTGFVVTSGLALGVDGAAHQGALAGQGKTIAVLGTGIDKAYPLRHRRLREELLAEGGTLVSEFPLGTGPLAANFPRRNRIISGMSLGVLVVEAAVKSGSLITARYAMQQGREVFAIPGSIHNPMSRGCHLLLREGATLVEQVEDLKEPLQGLLALKWAEAQSEEDGAKPNEAAPSLSADEKRTLEALGYEDRTLETLMSATGFAAGTLLAVLMQLELKGLVQQTPGGYQREAASAALS